MSTSTPEQLYETDFYAWTQAQAKELRRVARTRPNLPLDLEHLAEEIEDLGKSEHSAAVSFVRLIMQHFLLATCSPALGERLHWLDEVDESRSQLEDKLTPTIQRDLEASLDAVYAKARRNVQDAASRRERSGDGAPIRMPLHARADPGGVGAARRSRAEMITAARPEEAGR